MSSSIGQQPRIARTRWSCSPNSEPVGKGILPAIAASSLLRRVQRAEGWFRSNAEETLLTHIATRKPRKILNVAHDLRRFLNQIGIGISHNGIYQRVREWSDDAFILETLCLPPHLSQPRY